MREWLERLRDVMGFGWIGPVPIGIGLTAMSLLGSATPAIAQASAESDLLEMNRQLVETQALRPTRGPAHE